MTKVYGDADPELTYQVTEGSLAFDDSFMGELAREVGEEVGAYAILQGTLSLDGNYILSYLGADLTIQPFVQATTTGLSGPANGIWGEQLTFSVSVVPASAACGVPDGSIQLYDGETLLAALDLVDGQAQFVSSSLVVGEHAIKAVYSGAACWQGSESAVVSVAIDKAPVAVTLASLEHIYDGTAKAVSVSTEPAVQAVDVTYEGSGEAPVGAGSYAVVATVVDANFWGSATGTLVIAKATASVTLSNLDQIEDGAPKAVTVTTEPAGLSLDVIYDGSAVAPASPGSYTVVATVNDANFQGIAMGTLTIHMKPVPLAVPGGPYLAAMDAPITFDGSLSSDPEGDVLAFAWDFGDGATGTGAMPSHSYAAAGIYNVCLIVNDGTTDSAPTCTMAVIYDPNGGFVTGGGWIDSPAGAYTADPTLTGRATFGFVSKYKKGTSVPEGNTEFQFEAGSLSFHSTSYEWLVVAGAKAMFKGVGTIDETGNYGFLLTATDGEVKGGGGIDLFRIKIWDKDNGDAVVYDNQMGADEDSDAGTALGGGSIVIHTK